jgi:DNA polymerase III subunit delta
VWGRRQGAMERAAKRVSAAALTPMLRALARLDALSKGIGAGNAWDDLRDLALELAGHPAVPLATRGP